MIDPVWTHYAGHGKLSLAIADSLRAAGKETGSLTTLDLAPVDEFHIRGRKATVELARHMGIGESSEVIDIGSGLGGPARTIAEIYGCHVTGVDLVPAFCEAAADLTGWVGLSDRVSFRQGDATDLPFPDDRFDAGMSFHAAMNIPAKDMMFREARRVLRSGSVFVVYDVLRGEGGDIVFPVPWARDPSISHLATPEEMELLLGEAGFDIREVDDSTEESRAWFEEMTEVMARKGPPPVTFQVFLGDDFAQMAKNQVRNLAERRIRTVSYICMA